MNRHFLKLLQIIASLGLLALVFYQVGIFSSAGRDEFLQMLKGASLTWLLASVAVGILVNMCSALKWYMLTRAVDMQAGYWRLFSYYLIGQFYNLFLPTSVGGDVVRSYQLGKFSGSQANALASVFVERYTGVLVLLLVAGLAVISQLAIFSVQYVIGSLIAFAIGLGVIAWMIIDQRFYQWLRRQLVSRWSLLEKVFLRVDRLLAAVDVYRSHRVAMIGAFINSLVFYFVAVLNVYVTALVFTPDMQFVDALIATPIIMLIMNIPLSLGNIGLMEFAYASILQLMGYSPALGLSVALLMRLKSLLDAALGGALYPVYIGRR